MATLAPVRRRSAPGRWGIVLLTLLSAAGSATRLDADEEPRPPRGGPTTALAAGALGESDLVVVGRLLSVRGERGIQVAQLEIERVLLGSAPSVLTVFVGGPRPTEDPRAPSQPYFEDDPSGRAVLLLARPPEGQAWRLLTRFAAEGLLGEEKIRVLEAHIRLMQVPLVSQRASQTLAFFLEALRAESVWTRVHAARELNYLVGVRPEVFDAAARRQIEDAARRTRIPTLRSWLARLLKSLSCVPPAPVEETTTPPDQRRLEEALGAAGSDPERVAVLVGALHDGGPRALSVVLRGMGGAPAPVRIAVLEHLMEGGWRGAAPLIRDRYAREEDPEVQRAIVRAVGRLGGAGEVDWLEARTEGLQVRREALFALARLRTPESRAALERVRERFRRAGTRDEDVTALVDYLLGPAFEEVERAEGRGLGPGR